MLKWFVVFQFIDNINICSTWKQNYQYSKYISRVSKLGSAKMTNFTHKKQMQVYVASRFQKSLEVKDGFSEWFN